jgi:glycosyltransferase involved in cell wall biosynthesis
MPTQNELARHLVWVLNASPRKLDIATWSDTSAELARMGWRVTLLVWGDQPPEEHEGVTLHGLATPDVYLGRQVGFHLAALRYVREHWDDIDVVLVHMMAGPMMPGLRWTRLVRGGGPLIVHDTRDVGIWDGRLTTALRLLYGGLERQMMNLLADGQTAITDRMAAWKRIPRRQYWGTWRSGVNVELFAPAQSRHPWPQGDEPVRLVYVGSMNVERTLPRMCEAVERVNAEGLAFTLDLVGNGPDRERLEVLAAETQGRIRVHPPVPHEQVVDYVAEAHVGVCPLEDSPVFQGSDPLKVLEYMAAGMPVLLTRIPCHTDAFGDAPFCFWAEDATVDDLAEGLRQVWAGRDALARMGAQAAEAAEDRTWRRSAQQLARALEVGLARHGRVAAPGAPRGAGAGASAGARLSIDRDLSGDPGHGGEASME